MLFLFCFLGYYVLFFFQCLWVICVSCFLCYCCLFFGSFQFMGLLILWFILVFVFCQGVLLCFLLRVSGWQFKIFFIIIRLVNGFFVCVWCFWSCSVVVLSFSLGILIRYLSVSIFSCSGLFIMLCLLYWFCWFSLFFFGSGVTWVWWIFWGWFVGLLLFLLGLFLYRCLKSLILILGR